MGAIQFIESLDRSSLTISPEEFESNVEAAIAKFAERPTPQSPPPSLPPKPRRPSTTAIREKGGADFPESGDEKLAVAGLLRSLQEPLSTIGRIFTGEGSSSSTGPPVTPRPGSSPNFGDGMADDAVLAAFGGRRHQPVKRRTVSAQESATRQAAAEAEEAARIGMMEYEHVVETLQRMFPGLDRDVICDVVNIKEGQ